MCLEICWRCSELTNSGNRAKPRLKVSQSVGRDPNRRPLANSDGKWSQATEKHHSVAQETALKPLDIKQPKQALTNQILESNSQTDHAVAASSSFQGQSTSPSKLSHCSPLYGRWSSPNYIVSRAAPTSSDKQNEATRHWSSVLQGPVGVTVWTENSLRVCVCKISCYIRHAYLLSFP